MVNERRSPFLLYRKLYFNARVKKRPKKGQFEYYFSTL